MASITKASFIEFLFKGNQWPIVILSSVILSFLTIGLDWSSTWLSDAKYGYCSTNVFAVEQACQEGWIDNFSTSWTQFVNVVSCTLVFAGIASYIASTNDHIQKSGISELILIIGGHEDEDFLQFNVIWKKILSLILVFASGSLLIGYEGPLIHISCGIIYLIIKFMSNRFKIFHALNNPETIRELLVVGFVIGISLAFATPIGGLLFAVENLKFGSKTSKLMWYGFVCASIATFIFIQLHPFKNVSINDSFTVGIENNWILIETIPYIFVGFVSGFIALLFNKLHINITELRSRYINTASKGILVLEVISIAGISQLLRYLLPFAKLTMSEFLNTLFFDCELQENAINKPAICQAGHLTFDLVYYLIMMIFLTPYTYATQIPGGVLLPSLTIGALSGRIIGEFMQFLQSKSDSYIFQSCHLENKSCVSPGSYALVGAAAMFAGVTNTSVSAVVIVFELTGAVTYLVPLMLGVFVSRVTNDVLLGNSSGLYEQWLTVKNNDYIKPNLEASMAISQFSAITVGELANENLKVVYASELTSIGDLRSLLDGAIDDDYGIVVLNSKYDKTIVGWAATKNIKLALSAYNLPSTTLVTFGKSDEPHIIQLHAHLTLVADLTIVSSQISALTAYEMLDRMNINFLMVISPVSGDYIGIVLPYDIVQLKNGH